MTAVNFPHADWSNISFSEGGNGYYGTYQFDSWEGFLRNEPARLEVVPPGSDAAAKNATELVFGPMEDAWASPASAHPHRRHAL